MNTADIISFLRVFFTRAFIVFPRSILRVLFLFEFEIEGREFVRGKDGIILTGNHTGFFDQMILVSALGRSPRFLELRRGLGRPSVRIQHAIQSGTETLKRGGVVCVFPQGRPVPGAGIVFHPGVVQLCRESKSPIVPFAIHLAGRKLTVQFGQPIVLRDDSEAALLAEIHDIVQFMKDSLARRYKPPRERRFQESVLSLMLLKSDVYGSRIATCLQENGRWNELSFLELSRKARNLSDYLIHWGLKRGDRVSILSESRPEWGIAFFATVRSGGVLVPLDIKLTSAEMVSILSDSEPRVLFVSREYAEKGLALKTLIPSLEEVILLDAPADMNLRHYETLRSPEAFRGRNREVDEVALLIYTSGTTGNPKGVMITFGNLVYQVKNFNEILALTPKDMYLSILPLNHLFELTGGFIGVLHAGGSVCYSLNLHPQEIARLMREKRITGMITVPLFLKMLKLSIEKEVRRKSSAEQKIFKIIYALSAYVPFRRIRQLMFASIHRRFGGRLRGFISGGAPLDLEVGEFFNRIGIPVYQGYGLTETSPVVSVNTPKHSRFGSVGRPLKGVSVEIRKAEGEDEGEIVTRGPHIMKGYYKRPDLTREVIDEWEWFRTGDLGRIDRDGYLYITGRIKNLIVLGGGKKVHPEEVETCLSKSDLFREVCVAGIRSKDDEDVTAAIVPVDTILDQYRDDPKTLEQIVKKEAVRLAQDLAPYKRPSKIFIHPGEMPKTATRKIRRPLISQWLREQMETIRPGSTVMNAAK